MSARMYLYEVESDNHWLAAQHCAPENATLAAEVARWAKLPADPQQARWLALPGDERAIYFSPRVIVSTVPLAWLPESSRRGFVTLGGAK
jgi:hypothetical protein